MISYTTHADKTQTLQVQQSHIDTGITIKASHSGCECQTPTSLSNIAFMQHAAKLCRPFARAGCGRRPLLHKKHGMQVRQQRSCLLVLLPARFTQSRVLHGQAKGLGAQHVQLLGLQPQQIALTLCHSCELVLAGNHLSDKLCWAQDCHLLKLACHPWQPPCCRHTHTQASLTCLAMRHHLALECWTNEEVHWKLVKASDLPTLFSAPCVYTMRVQPCYCEEHEMHISY